jgi:hypothetical protein
MDDDRFDHLARSRAGEPTRRLVLRGAAAALALLGGAALLPDGGASAKKGKGKGKGKKTKRCRTVGGVAVCKRSQVCCSPNASTGGGCAPKGYPVCCLAAGFAYPAGTTCCDSPDAGNGGACEDPDYPNCCPPSIQGCCEKGSSLCCVHPTVGPYCCPGDSTCCPDTETGCCTSLNRADGAEPTAVPRGDWLAPHDAGRRGTYDATG